MKYLGKGSPTAKTGREYGITRKFEALEKFVKFSNKIVLDIGCGFGAYGKIAKLNGAEEVVGIDITCDYLDKKNKCHNILADACMLPLKASCFDIVFLIEVLEHLYYEKSALNEIKHVIKNNGRILISVPNRFYPFETHGIRIGSTNIWNLFGIGIPFFSWMPTKIRNKFERAKIYSIKNLYRLFTTMGFNLLKVDYMMPPLDKLKNQNMAMIMRKIFKKLESSPFKYFSCSIITILSKMSHIPSKTTH